MTKYIIRRLLMIIPVLLGAVIIDDVGILYPVLQEARRQKDQGEFLLRARELAANLRHLGRMEQPYLFNIL